MFIVDDPHTLANSLLLQTAHVPSHDIVSRGSGKRSPDAKRLTIALAGSTSSRGTERVGSGMRSGPDQTVGKVYSLHTFFSEVSLNKFSSFVTYLFQSLKQHTNWTTSGWVGRIDDSRLEFEIIIRDFAVFKRAHLFQRQYRVAHHEALAMLGAWFRQKISLRANKAAQRHHNFFTNRVDWWVYHLAKRCFK